MIQTRAEPNWPLVTQMDIKAPGPTLDFHHLPLLQDKGCRLSLPGNFSVANSFLNAGLCAIIIFRHCFKPSFSFTNLSLADSKAMCAEVGD